MEINKIKLIFDFFHRLNIHHAMWFGELVHQYGREEAYKILNKVYPAVYENNLKRFAKLFNIKLNDNNIPEFLSNLSENEKDSLLEAIAINWLSCDGIWFQAVENAYGMFEAKRCNDSCWANFSPFEANSIKNLLNLEKNAGLEGLKKALNLRLYAYINKQTIKDIDNNSFVFYMNECRVQVARKNKNLPDYPCKSAGLIEYSSFAKAIDSRIKTECICCPPDDHPEEYYCAWKFSISEE